MKRLHSVYELVLALIGYARSQYLYYNHRLPFNRRSNLADV